MTSSAAFHSSNTIDVRFATWAASLEASQLVTEAKKARVAKAPAVTRLVG
jgi:hypothetical protein